MKQFISNNRFFLCLCVIQLFVFSFLASYSQAQHLMTPSNGDVIFIQKNKLNKIRLSYGNNMGDMPDIGIKAFIGIGVDDRVDDGGSCVSSCAAMNGDWGLQDQDGDPFFISDNGTEIDTATLFFRMPDNGNSYTVQLKRTYVDSSGITQNDDIEFFLELRRTIPTMSEWGLFLFFLTMLSLSLVTLYRFQLTTAKSSMEQTLTMPNAYRLPFDITLFKKAIPYALGAAVLGFVVILMIWGAIGSQDGVGMALAVPMMAYLVHLVWLMGKK